MKKAAGSGGDPLPVFCKHVIRLGLSGGGKRKM
jgi:hypothetical protein